MSISFCHSTEAQQRLALGRRNGDFASSSLGSIPSVRTIALIGFLCFWGCSSSSSSGPLSIKMFNPKTQRVLLCAASDNRGGDTAALAAIVENCARQLESQGFVRAN